MSAPTVGASFKTRLDMQEAKRRHVLDALADLERAWAHEFHDAIVRAKAAERERDEARRAEAELRARVEGLANREPEPRDHAMLCGKFRDGSSCFRPSCSCWCHGNPEGVVSLATLRAALKPADDQDGGA